MIENFWVFIYGYVIVGVCFAIFVAWDNKFFKVLFPSAWDYLKVVFTWPIGVFILVRQEVVNGKKENN